MIHNITGTDRFIATFCFIILTACGSHDVKRKLEFPGPDQLYRQAVEESLVPVHPGRSGETPFWNTYAQRFIYVPSFEFENIDGASQYRYTVTSDSAQARFTFTATSPQEPLTAIWDRLPVGKIELTVTAISQDKEPDVSGHREFFKASPYHGPYHATAVSYHESVKRLLYYLYNCTYMQHWLTAREPDPEYGLYCYPSKMIAAVIKGMILFGESTDVPEEKENAIRIAGIAADYLIGLSEAEGTAMEFFPPTYTGSIYADMQDEWRGESLADRIMLIYPAVAGEAYLDLFDKTNEGKYLNAALRIAETYKKLQLPNGSWHLLIYVSSGKPVGSNFVVPTGIIHFLNRLTNDYKKRDYSDNVNHALQFIQENVVDEFNWEGQFEDQKPSGKYKNLSKGQACSYARYLLETFSDNRKKIDKALELIRFAEDQFVIWDNNATIDSWGIKSDQWITPCVLEQYNFYTPVNASSADMINVFIQADEKTGNILHLAKAMALANTIVITQDRETGHYPTYLVRNLLDQEGWINCMVYTAEALNNLDSYIRSKDLNPIKK